MTPLITTIISVILTALVGGIITFFVWVTKQINKLITSVAVLIEHNVSSDRDILDSKKAHDEIIDLKLASSELDVKMKILWADREYEITENKEEVKTLRERML